MSSVHGRPYSSRCRVSRVTLLPTTSVTSTVPPVTAMCSPRLGDVAKQVMDVARDGLVATLGQLDPGAPGEVLDADPAVDVGEVGSDVGVGDVVLVTDLTDELLDDVLEGDDPVGAAVLVDDHGEVYALLPHDRDGRAAPAWCRGA